ncbi:MAG: hypothetical protein PHD55_05895 [Methanoregula sp.]|jgi:hypothetical protein|nr:hypothetical protein [Methanoregula sp.]
MEKEKNNRMNAARLLLILCAVAVTGGLIVFLAPVLTGTTNAGPDPLPLYMIENQDPARNHTVLISVSNATDEDFFKETFMLSPREQLSSAIPSPDSFQKFTFTISVDGAGPSQERMDLGPTTVAVIDIQSPSNKNSVSCSVIDLTPVSIRGAES